MSRTRTDRLIKESSAELWLLVALALSAVAAFLPFGHFLLYPFALFETFVHETCHALAAMLTGGSVLGMNVNWDTSGLTRTMGGSRFLTSSAGYLGTTIVGAALLLLARRTKRAPATLLVLGGLTLVATLLFAGYGAKWASVLGLGAGASLLALGRAQKSEGRSGDGYIATGGVLILAVVAYLIFTGGFLTWAVGLVIGLSALAVGAGAPRWIAHGYLMFLAVQTTLGSLAGLRVLLGLSMGGGGHSDAANMAELTGVPAVAWALGWGALGMIIVAAALGLFWRDRQSD